MWSSLAFAAASRRVDNYFGCGDRSLGHVRSTEVPTITIDVLEPDAISTVPASAPFSLGPPLSSPPLPSAPHASMTSPTFSASKIAPVPVAPFSVPLVPTHFVSSSPVGQSSAILPVSTTINAGPSPGACVALDGRSLTSLFSTCPSLSRSRAVVASAGSLPVSASDAGVSGAAGLARQLAVAKLQRDTACQELAAITCKLHSARDEIDELRMALALLHDLCHESRSLLLALVSQLDAVSSQSPSSDNMHDASFWLPCSISGLCIRHFLHLYCSRLWSLWSLDINCVWFPRTLLCHCGCSRSVVACQRPTLLIHRFCLFPSILHIVNFLSSCFFIRSMIRLFLLLSSVLSDARH